MEDGELRHSEGAWCWCLAPGSWKLFPGSLVGIKDIDFVGRSEAETLETGAVGRYRGTKEEAGRASYKQTFT